MDTATIQKDIYRSKYGETPRLTSINYHSWSRATQFVLRAAQCWRIVTREEQRPEPPTAGNNTRVWERYEDKLEQYNTHYDTAAAIIYQSCSTQIQAYIGTDMDPQTMWQTLKERLDNTTNEGGPILLRERLHNERYDGEGSISSFISTVLTYYEQLAVLTKPSLIKM